MGHVYESLFVDSLPSLFNNSDACNLVNLAWILFYIFLVLTVLGPVVFIACIYACAIYIVSYKEVFRMPKFSLDGIWDDCRHKTALWLRFVGRLWHAYEVAGLEKIPEKGGALLIFYHSPMPHDFFYFWAEMVLRKKRLPLFVLDKFAHKLPLWKQSCAVVGMFSGKYEDVVAYLKEGSVVAIAPGGLRECHFGGENYELLWNKRIGFAKAALEAKVPIIPIFTQNGREAFKVMNFKKNWFRRLYEKTRLPVIPVYGGFPVKEISHVGRPLQYNPNLTPEELAEKTADVLRGLIREKQRIPGSVILAVMDRFF